MLNISPGRLGFFLILAWTASLGTFGATTAARAQQGASVHAERQERTGNKLTVGIVADGVDNLGGFSFVLSWDPAALKLDDIGVGPFLSQTGRKPFCPQPATQDGATRIACVTIDQNAAPGKPALTQVAGASGSGTISLAHFEVLKDGNAAMHLSKVSLVDPYGNDLPSHADDTTIALGGSGGSQMGIVLGVAGGIALLVIAGIAALLWRRRRAAADAQAESAEQPLHSP